LPSCGSARLETSAIAARVGIEVRRRYESFEFITSTDEFISYWEPRMAHRRGQVIASATTKGGVGKSTLAGNPTWALATQTGRRVLLVDADPQALMTKGFDPAAEDRP
jgi:Mrp family chromosome partitioning ATPase